MLNAKIKIMAPVDNTEKEFEMIYEALENLPHKDVPGEMLGMMFEGLLSNKDDKEKWREDQKRKMLEAEQKKRQVVEDVRLLQAKVIQLKRWLIENRLVKKATDIINED